MLDRRKFMLSAASVTAGATVAPYLPQFVDIAAAQEAELGSHLIGTLEGPTVVTDPALFPSSFSEAPQLAEKVSAGDLPPVAERIGEDPLVLEPLHEIGTYGGSVRRGFTGPSDQWCGARFAGHDMVLWKDFRNAEIVPNVAKSWEWSENGTVLTLNLRKGMRWSDGHPFTTDDFMFWYEDMYLNSDLTKSPSSDMAINGQQVTMEKVDDVTVRYICPAPYPMLVDVLAGNSIPGAGPAQYGRRAQGGFAPAHYLKQFHPNYVAADELDAMAKAEGYDNWVNLFLFKIDWAINTDVPTVAAWKSRTPANTPVWILERNPYSFIVDTAGNQLPYLDEVTLTLAEDLEVLNLRAIAGEYDFQARHVDMRKLPVFLENQEKGGYDVHLDPAAHGGDFIIRFNLSYPEDGDPEIAKWVKSPDFRRALGLGIDRDQLNETFWLGLGKTGSVAPADDNQFFPGPEYRTMWAHYDPDKANEMLDAIGLDKKDADGFRLRSDGNGRLRLELMTLTGAFLPFTQIAEVVAEQWAKIGIQADVQEVERGLGLSRVSGNDYQLWAWSNDTSDSLFTSIHVVPLSTSPASQCPQFGVWYSTNGEEGIEPPERVQEAMDLYRQATAVNADERIEFGKAIWRIAVEDVWAIGTVGQSPAQLGVRVNSTKLGNIPARQFNSTDVRTPGGSRPETFFWKAT